MYDNHTGSARRCLALGAFAALALCNRVAGASLPPAAPERACQRPRLQYFADSTSSYISKVTAPPAGTTFHTLEFDYFVDSEPNFDKLNVYENANLRWTISGQNQSGRKALTLSNASSKVTFEYVKNGSISLGLDTASIDNITLRSNGRPYENHNCNGAAGAVPAGWSVGGTGKGSAGFAIAIPYTQHSVARAASQYHMPNSSSYMQRSVFFGSTTGNHVTFRYFIDSEPNFDLLKVWDGANLIFQASGNPDGTPNVGTADVAIPGGGTHVIKFEYTKDGSVDRGRDTARLGYVGFLSGFTPFEEYSFFGLTENAAPTGWTTGGSSTGYGMLVTKAAPHVSYVARQAFNTEPVVDGTIGLAEYNGNATTIALPSFGSAAANQGRLVLAESSTTDTFYVNAVLPSDNISVGNESGSITLYFDTARTETLSGFGCTGNMYSPDSGDRRITFNYTIGSGTVARISALTQAKGNCVGGYSALGSDPAWRIRVAMREPLSGANASTTKGLLYLEIAVQLPARRPILADNQLGFGFKRQNSAGTLVERFPYRDDALLLPLDSEVYSLETVVFNPLTNLGPEQSEAGWDGCCLPRKDRRHW